MEIDHLREFIALAEHASFTKAAAAIHVSHPVFSKHIAALEDELGVQLIDRDTRPLTLTALGKAFIGDARTNRLQLRRINQKAAQAATLRPTQNHGRCIDDLSSPKPILSPSPLPS